MIKTLIMSVLTLSLHCDLCLKEYRICLFKTVSDNFYGDIREAQLVCKTSINKCAKKYQCRKDRK